MRILLLAILLISQNIAFAQIKFAQLFTDHAVLQRQQPIPIWGWAKPGEKVSVNFNGKSISSKANANGKWEVIFPAMEAGGPYQISVSNKGDQKTIQDILIGEVWLCSGQSNMEWPTSRAQNFEQEKANANFPQIRHYKVPNRVSLSPEQDLEKGEWQVASSATIGDFSAIGFFFARELTQELNVPVGILNTSWGASQIEGWIGKNALEQNPEFKSYAPTIPDTWPGVISKMDHKLHRGLAGPNASFPTADQESQYPTVPFADLKGLKTDSPIGEWDWRGLSFYRGNTFMATEFVVPEGFSQGKITLGSNEFTNTVHVNNQIIHNGTLDGTALNIPSDILKAGTNTLAIHIGKHKSKEFGSAGLFGKLSDLKLFNEVDTISLQKNWKIVPVFSEKHTYSFWANSEASLIYNGMIAPLIPYGLKGFLWYQGESNVNRANQYKESFPLLIDNWRKDWKNDQLPFYWVQLSSYGPSQDSNKGSYWAELREAQDYTLKVPQTGMAVTIDIGNPDDIHPANKQEVAHRLAANALKKNYHKNKIHASPLYDKSEFKEQQAIIYFQTPESKLVIKDKYGYLKGFEIAGDDHVFHYAQAELKDNQVIVSHPLVKKPTAVRYGWSDSPLDANLFNEAGFPVSPFRTDQWPGLSINNKFD
jgi:sialate O-acetylesterase